MADDSLVRLILEDGVEAWNRARISHPDYPRCDIYEEACWGADLSMGNLAGACLDSAILLGADLRGADLRGADLSNAWLHQADLSGANCQGTRLDGALLADTKLCGANLRRASFRKAKIEGDKRRSYPSHIVVGTDLTGADLTAADLTHAEIWNSCLVNANLTDADITDSTIVEVEVYGTSMWGLKGTPARQGGIRARSLQFDDLRVALFADLFLSNHLNLGSIIEIGAKKGVLILGRFGKERKRVLDAIYEKLKSIGYSPMVFDFERPPNRDFTETVLVLAGISLFVIADVTSPRSVPLELQATIPNFMIPFVPIIERGEKAFAMFSDLKNKYEWVLDLLEYDDLEKMLSVFERAVVQPALEKRDDLQRRKADQGRTRSIDDYR